MADIHQNQPVLTAGLDLDGARAAMIMIHGRGASAAGMLDLAREFQVDGFAYLAPQASGYTWYPYSFLFPIVQNEPHLSSALEFLDAQVERARAAGLTDGQVFLLGFSQGACLASEYAARNPRRYGGVIALSGGLIGPEGTPRDYPGRFDGTPVFLGCSDIDSHIPVERVDETAEVFERMGADVTKRIYPGMGHTVNQDEIVFIRGLLESAILGTAPGHG